MLGIGGYIMKKFNKILSLLLVFSFLLLSVGCKTSELEKKSADLVNYYIDANYDDVTHTVTASQIVDYINTTETDLNVVCFKLYPTAFSKDAKVLPYTNANKDKCFPNSLSYGDIEISNVKVEDADAEWAIIGEDNNILEVKLFVPLENLKINPLFLSKNCLIFISPLLELQAGQPCPFLTLLPIGLHS